VRSSLWIGDRMSKIKTCCHVFWKGEEYKCHVVSWCDNSCICFHTKDYSYVVYLSTSLEVGIIFFRNVGLKLYLGGNLVKWIVGGFVVEQKEKRHECGSTRQCIPSCGSNFLLFYCFFSFPLPTTQDFPLRSNSGIIFIVCVFRPHGISFLF
jgi:hypothetical protein